MPSKFNFHLYLLWFFFAFVFLNRIIKKFKPDILHGGYVPTAGSLCALTNFHPFLLMPWGSDILIFPDKSFIHRFLIKYIIRKADAVVCDAAIVKNKMLEIYPNQKENRISIFPWGINLDHFKPHQNSNIREQLSFQNCFVIICTRNHKPIYGIEVLLEAFKDLVKTNDNIRLLILGSGSLTNRYVEYTKKNGLTNYVEFVGRIPNSDLPLYLNSSDIYVSSSFSDGTSVSLLEAMACKLPVIVSDIPSNREWVDNGLNGFIFEKGSSKDLADKILQLVNNSELSNKQATENYKIASAKADWNKNFMKLEKVYNILKG